MDEEEKAKKRSSYQLGQDLSDLSVSEITDMIIVLKEEIERLDTAGKAKSDHLSAADALFKT